MSRTASYLGLDIGTSGCKAVAFDTNGQRLASAGREYHVHLTADGRAELCSEEVRRQHPAMVSRGIRPGPERDYAEVLKTAAPEPTKLLVLPYWTPSGTPYFEVQTPGAILGLRLSSTRGDVLRALLEGVAFEMRLSLDILERSGCRIDELRAVGGGAKSAWWTQLKADVLGKAMTTLGVTEAGCLCAAMLACSADTAEPVASLAARWVKPVTRIQPQPSSSSFYTERFALYRTLLPAMRRIYE